LYLHPALQFGGTCVCVGGYLWSANDQDSSICGKNLPGALDQPLLLQVGGLVRLLRMACCLDSISIASMEVGGMAPGLHVHCVRAAFNSCCKQGILGL
jgi:hypothetical protein